MRRGRRSPPGRSATRPTSARVAAFLCSEQASLRHRHRRSPSTAAAYTGLLVNRQRVRFGDGDGRRVADRHGPERDLGGAPRLRPGVLLAARRRRPARGGRAAGRARRHRLGRRLHRPALRPGQRARQDARPDRRPRPAPGRGAIALLVEGSVPRRDVGVCSCSSARSSISVAALVLARGRRAPHRRAVGRARRARSRSCSRFPMFLGADATTAPGTRSSCSSAAWGFAIGGLVPQLLRGVARTSPLARDAHYAKGATSRRGRPGGVDMKAVILAGGEGTRLRPLTSNQPKPMMPIANVPMMEHIVAAARPARLRRHRRDGRVPRQPHPQLLRRRLRLRRHACATRPRTRRSAPRVRCATRSDELDETFLVISGDVLTDIDLDRAREAAHRARARSRSIALKRVENPVEFGIVITQRRRHDRAVPREADVGRGVLRHDQHRHLRARARGVRLHPRGRGRRLLGRRVPGGARRRASRCSVTSSTATGKTSARSRRTAARTTTCSTAGSTSTSRASSCARACGSARAPTCRPTPSVDGPVLIGDNSPGRGRRACCGRTPCSAPTSW